VTTAARRSSSLARGTARDHRRAPPRPGSRCSRDDSRPRSSAADRLRSKGADVVYGDFDNPASIALAAAGVDALFATGTAHKVGPEGEINHGLNIADAAAAAGVPHLVYSSGDGAGEDSSLPLLQGKSQIERHIRSLANPHTILAPVYFMENLFNPWNLPLLRAGVFPSPIPVDMPLQQLAIVDLAALAVGVIEQPDRFVGQRIAVASDELTAVEAATVISRVIGRDLRAEQISPEHLAPPLRALFAWLEQVGHEVDLHALHGTHPEVGWHTYRAWARSQRSRFHELCPHETAGMS
jgi:uncharacterized protein YbjT (DUF2867 family)